MVMSKLLRNVRKGLECPRTSGELVAEDCEHFQIKSNFITILKLYIFSFNNIRYLFISKFLSTYIHIQVHIHMRQGLGLG